jgi:hypothetical protein
MEGEVSSQDSLLKRPCPLCENFPEKHLLDLKSSAIFLAKQAQSDK